MSQRREEAARMLRGGIASVLRVGTLVAVAAIAGGYAWALTEGGRGPTDRSVVELIASGGPDAFIGAGLLGLTLVPIVVVGVAAAGFYRAGEGRLAWLSVGVGLLLVASLVAAAVIGAG